MADETKVCPYCGEEILAIAKKCKHCGEFLDGSSKPVNSNSVYSGKFQNVDVNDKWKERFELIDLLVLDGRWWKTNPKAWKMSAWQRAKLSFKLYLIDPLSTLAMFLGLFYYLFKGMWVKALVYLAISFATGGAGSVLFFFFAPYDYYRLKVLGKQW